MHAEHGAPRPVVLLVDPDPALRRLLRLGLELDGARVLESGSVEQARELLADPLAAAEVAGVVVACELPDAPAGRAVEELQRLLPGNPLIVTAVDVVDVGDDGGSPLPERNVVRGDVQAVLDVLHLSSEAAERRRLVAVDVLCDEADLLAQRWRELCRWDPLLPPEATPPAAGAVIRALATALDRPQPLGWGPDPDVEQVAEVFAMGIGSVESAVGTLVCLREVLRRRLAGALPADEEAETWARLHMIVDRAMGVAVARIAGRLEQQAYVDTLTGLLNRRALDRDLRREAGRAARYGRRFAVVLLDLDGLKRVNDHEGHAAGDAVLRRLAAALQEALRLGDAAYRIGGDEFVVLLPELPAPDTAESVMARVAEAGAPAFGWGAASFPDDGTEPDALLQTADERMLADRAARRAVRST